MRDLKIWIAAASVLLIVYLVAQYNKPAPVNWNETFDRADKIPYGTYIAYNRLRDIFPGAGILPERQAPYLTFTEDSIPPGNYIIVSRWAKIDEYDFRELEKYIRKGNNVFIAAYYPGKYLADTLKLSVRKENKAGRGVAVRFRHPALGPQKQYRFDKGIGDQYFDRFDSARAEVLGVNERGHANFLRFRYGRGSLFILAGPHFFTNYAMLSPDGAEYAAKALSCMPVKKLVVWDEFSSLGNEEQQSLMRVFFRHPELRWAYYITLFSMLVFVIYGIKRRQRIIPVIEPLRNTSAEFVTVVGQVYYEQRDHTDIARKRVTYLLEYIRTRYGLKMDKPDKDFAERLTAKSGAGHELVTDLVRQIAQLEKYTHVSDQELIELNRNIESFYQQSV